MGWGRGGGAKLYLGGYSCGEGCWWLLGFWVSRKNGAGGGNGGNEVLDGIRVCSFALDMRRLGNGFGSTCY